jgi:hypothetical protein
MKSNCLAPQCLREFNSTRSAAWISTLASSRADRVDSVSWSNSARLP